MHSLFVLLVPQVPSYAGNMQHSAQLESTSKEIWDITLTTPGNLYFLIMNLQMIYLMYFPAVFHCLAPF